MRFLGGWVSRRGQSPLFGVHSFCTEVKSVHVCGKVCACVHAYLQKGGVAMGVAYCKKVHNFQLDSQTCTRFSAKVGHEPKDS